MEADAKKKGKNKMRYILILLGLLVANAASAMDCEKVPDCESLGYSQEEDTDCEKDGFMYCPFDKSYKKCVQYSCEALGFTESDKTSWCEEVISCPSDKALTLCKTLQLQCEIGDVFFADRTCGKASDWSKESGKIPVGIVYYVEEGGRHGRVINLKNLWRGSDYLFHADSPYSGLSAYMPWGYHTYDIETLKNYDYRSEILNALQTRDPDLYKGEENTKLILEAKAPDCAYQKNTKEYAQYCVPTAALAAHQFYPPEAGADNLYVGQGKWYLPSWGEWMEVYGYDNSKIVCGGACLTTNTSYNDGTSGAIGNHKDLIESALQTLQEKGFNTDVFSEKPYWSSTEFDWQSSRIFDMTNGGRSAFNKFNADNGYHAYVRASLKF